MQIGLRWEDLDDYEAAISSYQRCIQDCKKALKIDPRSLQPQLNKAWAYGGMSACYSKRMQKLNSELQMDRETLDQMARLIAEIVRPVDATRWIEILRLPLTIPRKAEEQAELAAELAANYESELEQIEEERESRDDMPSQRDRVLQFIAQGLGRDQPVEDSKSAFMTFLD